MKTFAAFMFLAFALFIPAASASDAKTQQQCADAFDACIAACNTTYKGDTAGRAACMPQCSGKYAACDAGVAYEQAKPWLEDQARKTKKFFDDLLKGLENDAPAEDTPTKKSI